MPGTPRTDSASRLIAGERIVQTVEFESGDPAFAGTMVMTWSLEAVPGGTGVAVRAVNVPSGIAVKDHEAGLASSLANLARFIGRRYASAPSLSFSSPSSWPSQ